MFLQTMLPVLFVLGLLGLVVAAVLWGEDSALTAAVTRDGRAIRWSLRPDKR